MLLSCRASATSRSDAALPRSTAAALPQRCNRTACTSAQHPRQPLTAKAATEGAEIPYELCCQALHDDEAARLAAPPDDILKARYSAYVERKPDFIIDTTHPSNEEYDEDREAWRARILDFAAAAKFLQLVIYDSVPIDEETHSITWNARIKVLDGLVDERLVETKDFVERSLFVKEDGRWLYLKGDPDFEPRNVGWTGRSTRSRSRRSARARRSPPCRARGRPSRDMAARPWTSRRRAKRRVASRASSTSRESQLPRPVYYTPPSGSSWGGASSSAARVKRPCRDAAARRRHRNFYQHQWDCRT